MFQQSAYSDQLTFFQKLKSFDIILLICILSVGIISCFSMYSTDGGELLYHSKSHIVRFLIFFSLMIVLSFFNIKFWHSIGYFFYATVFGLYNQYCFPQMIVLLLRDIARKNVVRRFVRQIQLTDKTLIKNCYSLQRLHIVSHYL